MGNVVLTGAASIVVIALLALSSCGGNDGSEKQAAASENRPSAEPRKIIAAQVTEDGQALRVIYESAPALELVRATLERTDERLVVTVLERLPGPGAYHPIAEQVCRDIPLEEPVGERVVIDGATSRPVKHIDGRAEPPPSGCEKIARELVSYR